MVRPGLADESGTAGRSLDELIKFAKSRVPRREWWKTKVQLMASGEGITERIFENYRRALRTSGFAFRDEWVRLVKGLRLCFLLWLYIHDTDGSYWFIFGSLVDHLILLSLQLYLLILEEFRVLDLLYFLVPLRFVSTIN